MSGHARRGNRSIEIRVDEETRERWTRAAAEIGLNLSEFIRWVVEEKLSNVPEKTKRRETRTAAKRRQADDLPAPTGKRSYEPDFKDLPLSKGRKFRV